MGLNGSKDLSFRKLNQKDTSYAKLVQDRVQCMARNHLGKG